MLFRQAPSFSLRRVALLVGDVGCVVCSLVLAAFLRLRPTEVAWLEYLARHVPALSGISAIFLLVFYAGGMYERAALLRSRNAFLLPLISVAIGLVVNAVVFYARFRMDIGRGILFLAALFILFSTWGLRHLYVIAVGRGLLSRKAILVGEGQAAADVLGLVRRTPDAGFKLFGAVCGSRGRRGDFLHGLPVLGPVSSLREFVDLYDIETVLVAASPAREPGLLRALRPLRYAGIEILDYTALHEELAQEIPLDHIDDEWLMNAAMNSSVIHIRQIKRIMDVVAAVAGLVLLAPVALVVAAAVRLDSRGPAFYRQRRAGLEGKPYTLLKFRTMRMDAEAESGAVWAGRRDRRVTRVGRFLRTSRLDEIPQLVNVLRGEMSLVGPRPERPEFIDTLAEAIPFYGERLLVPPGITGWAQVKYPYSASIEAARRKLQYDLYYVKHMSLVFDLQILLRTFKTILAGLRHSDELSDEERGSGGQVLPAPVAPAPAAGERSA